MCLVVNKGSQLIRLILIILLLKTVTVDAGSIPQNPLDENSVVDLAIKNNPYVKEANLNLLAQKESERVAFSSRLPKIEFNYQYIYMKDKPYIIMDYQLPPLFPMMPNQRIKDTLPTGKNQAITYDLTISMPLFTGFYLEELHRAEKIGIDIRENIRESMILEISHQARTAYYNVLTQRRLLEVAKKSVEQLTSHLEEAENLYKAGLIPYNDLLKIKVHLAKMKERETEQEGNLKKAMTYLAVLIQEDPLKEIPLKDIATESIELPRLKLNDLVKVAMENRPEVKVQSLISKQIESYVKMAKSEYYPKINIFASYQRSGENILATENSYTNKENMIYGFKLNMNIFDFKRREHLIKKSEYELLSQKEREKQWIDRITNEVVSAYNDVLTAYRNFETARIALQQAEEDFRITKLQYASSIAKAIEVIDSEKALTEARELYYISLYNYHNAISRLMRACGIKDKNLLF